MGAFEIAVPDDLLDELVCRVVERIHEAPERRFLSKPALARHLGVAERTIRTWRAKGLPAHKVGRELMFSLEEVEEWINRHA